MNEENNTHTTRMNDLEALKEMYDVLEACLRDDCQRDRDDCPDCCEGDKYKSPDIEERK